MIRSSSAILVPLSVVQLILGALPPSAAGDSASMCLIADDADLTGDDIQIQVTISADDALILGGQFTVIYDPEVLILMDALPGRACDAASPFALDLLEGFDGLYGEARASFGIDFEEGLPMAGLSSTLACLTFSQIQEATQPTSVCLLKGENPFVTVLVDGVGHAVQIDNSAACPPDERPPILACVELTPMDDSSCVPGTTDCHELNTPCRTGVCDPLTLRCVVQFVNEGGSCDDDNFCTVADHCRAGACVGGTCRSTRYCVDSGACIGIIQPDTDRSDIVRRDTIPIE